MKVTIRDLKHLIQYMDDDAEIWLEYPERYGISDSQEIIKGPEESDFIRCMSIGKSKKENKLYIFHHY